MTTWQKPPVYYIVFIVPVKYFFLRSSYEISVFLDKSFIFLLLQFYVINQKIPTYYLDIGYALLMMSLGQEWFS